MADSAASATLSTEDPTSYSTSSPGSGKQKYKSNHPSSKHPAWCFVTPLAEKHWNCNICKKVFTGSVSRVTLHLLGKADAQKTQSLVAECSGGKTDESKEMLQDAKKIVKQYLADADGKKETKRFQDDIDDIDSNDEAPDAKRRNVSQSSITSHFTKGHSTSAEAAHAAIASWSYSTGVSFNAIDNPEFSNMCKVLVGLGGNSNADYKPPSRYMLSNRLLDAEVELIRKSLEAWEPTLQEVGCTMTSDGWTNKNTRLSLINYMVVCPKGAIFLEAVNTSEHEGAKDAAYIANGIIAQIEKFGPEKVFHVCTDGAAVMRAAWPIVESKFPHLTVDWCIAHVMDLLMEDIGKLPFFTTSIEEAKEVVKFIRNHQYTNKVFTSKSPKRTLLYPGETRFATSLIMLQRLVDVQTAVEETLSGTEFAEFLQGKSYAAVGDSVKRTVRDVDWWYKIKALCDILSPCVKVLRMADSNTPSAGKIQNEIWKLHDSLQGALESEALDDFIPVDTKARVKQLLSDRWDDLHSELHGAGLCLDPEFHDIDHYQANEGQPYWDLFAIVHKVYGNDDRADKALEQFSNYTNKIGMWGNEKIFRSAKNMPAWTWWQQWKGRVPELAKVAMRVLSQVSGAGAGERNWSTYGFIMSDLRNRLAPGRAEKLVYVHYNKRAVQRVKRVDYAESFFKWSEDDDSKLED
jgi:hypothetical protein